MPTVHGGHHFKHTILPDDISTLFTKALKKFEPITGHTTDSHFAELRKVMSQIILVIPYNEENGVHKLVSIIQDLTTYTSDYTTAFPRTRKPDIYDALIRDDEKAPVRSQKEATHKARCSDFTTFEEAERDAGKFISKKKSITLSSLQGK